jgi:hypothetical protein
MVDEQRGRTNEKRVGKQVPKKAEEGWREAVENVHRRFLDQSDKTGCND